MNPLSSLRSSLARLVYPYGAERTVLRGPARRSKFVVHPGMGATYALGLDGGIARFLASKVKRGATVYDLGGNRGQMALIFGQLVGPAGQVVSFEPVPRLAESLRRNIRLNRLHHVRVETSAVGDACGVALFALNDTRDTQGKLTQVEPSYVVAGARSLEVRVTTLDEFVATGARPPDLVKIDVEGAAGAVMRGAGGVFERWRPDVYVELHGPDEQRGVQVLLDHHEYEARTLDGVLVSDVTKGWWSPLWCSPTGGRSRVVLAPPKRRRGIDSCET